MIGLGRDTLYQSIKHCFALPFILPLILLLSACGGGGGGGKPAGITSQATSAQSLSLSASSVASDSGGVTSSSVTLSVVSSSSRFVPSSTAVSSFSSSSSSISAVSSFSISSSSVIAATVVISGRITYDFVPHFDGRDGLDYAATEARPGRGLLVELLSATNQVLASDVSDETGHYSFLSVADEPVRVRVKAQLLNTQSSGIDQWNVKVTDNTDSNSLYAMVGSLLVANTSSAVRDLHAPSGWTGSAYTQTRVAAPFAIIDSVLMGMQRLVAVDNSVQFPPLELRWSANNTTADGDLMRGEIGTSFYNGAAIYILGAENEDTDEYDRHVILHEWGHYIEDRLSRADSIGGAHAGGDLLDMRVAMSEGFANAFSAMMLDDPVYRDSSGRQQDDGFQIIINRIDNAVRGWYSEASVQSILYNYYTNDNNKTARDITDVFTTITRANFVNNEAFISIYVFAEQLRAAFPNTAPALNTLLNGQNIAITDRFGSGESNSGGTVITLPVYKTLLLDNTSVNVCSTNRIGSGNKLGVAQFLLLNISVSGAYRISAIESGTSSTDSDPDLYLYRRGILQQQGVSPVTGAESLTHELSTGIYLLELVDDRAAREDYTEEAFACFDVRATPI